MRNVDKDGHVRGGSGCPGELVAEDDGDLRKSDVRMNNPLKGGEHGRAEIECQM